MEVFFFLSLCILDVFGGGGLQRPCLLRSGKVIFQSVNNHNNIPNANQNEKFAESFFLSFSLHAHIGVERFIMKYYYFGCCLIPATELKEKEPRRKNVICYFVEEFTRNRRELL